MTEQEFIQSFEEKVNDLKWFKSKYKEIQNNYGGMYVVVENKDIIDSDADYFKLLKRLRGRGIDTSQLLIKKVPRVNEYLVYYA